MENDDRTRINTFGIHFRDELAHIQELTDIKESYDLHSTCLLMRTYKNKYLRIPWWKRIFIFSAFLSLLSCTCLPQIPDQVLYLDTACTATVPDYMTIFDVVDNCTDSQVIQYPDPGTVLDHPEPFSVDIIARDRYGNSSAVTFGVVIIDTIPPAIYYIGDTVLVYHQHELDQVIQSYVNYRQHIGDTSIQRSFKVTF